MSHSFPSKSVIPFNIPPNTHFLKHLNSAIKCRISLLILCLNPHINPLNISSKALHVIYIYSSVYSPKLYLHCWFLPFPAMVLYSLNERSGYKVAVWLALPLQSPLCTLDIPYNSLQERRWKCGFNHLVTLHILVVLF